MVQVGDNIFYISVAIFLGKFRFSFLFRKRGNMHDKFGVVFFVNVINSSFVLGLGILKKFN